MARTQHACPGVARKCIGCTWYRVLYFARTHTHIDQVYLDVAIKKPNRPERPFACSLIFTAFNRRGQPTGSGILVVLFCLPADPSVQVTPLGPIRVCACIFRSAEIARNSRDAATKGRSSARGRGIMHVSSKPYYAIESKFT